MSIEDVSVGYNLASAVIIRPVALPDLLLFYSTVRLLAISRWLSGYRGLSALSFNTCRRRAGIVLSGSVGDCPPKPPVRPWPPRRLIKTGSAARDGRDCRNSLRSTVYSRRRVARPPLAPCKQTGPPRFETDRRISPIRTGFERWAALHLPFAGHTALNSAHGLQRSGRRPTRWPVAVAWSDSRSNDRGYAAHSLQSTSVCCSTNSVARCSMSGG